MGRHFQKQMLIAVAYLDKVKYTARYTGRIRRYDPAEVNGSGENVPILSAFFYYLAKELPLSIIVKSVAKDGSVGSSALAVTVVTMKLVRA